MIRLERKHGVILLDDEDAWVTQEYLLKPRLLENGTYRIVKAQCKVTRRESTLGRVLLGITDRNLQADHINRDGFDNRRDNLRAVDRDLQNANRRSNNVLGIKGAFYSGGTNKTSPYRSALTVRKVKYYGRRRSSIEKAALDYNRMSIAVWGHQVVLNDVRCVDMDPRPADKNCLFCNAICHCCCVCLDPPSAGMRRLFEMLDAS